MSRCIFGITSLQVPSQLVQQQQQQQQMARVQTSPTKATSPTRHMNATNAAISALATSLMNSAQQFQQQAAGESCSFYLTDVVQATYINNAIIRLTLLYPD